MNHDPSLDRILQLAGIKSAKSRPTALNEIFGFFDPLNQRGKFKDEPEDQAALAAMKLRDDSEEDAYLTQQAEQNAVARHVRQLKRLYLDAFKEFATVSEIEIEGGECTVRLLGDVSIAKLYALHDDMIITAGKDGATIEVKFEVDDSLPG
jgi:Asp-tRNA(Asn)/Glu-tRNA(Gln) amidotransferase C subunit